MKETGKKKIAVINGPNINILGVREPEIYGKASWNQIEKELKKEALKLNLDIVFFQSNHEGDIVDFIQENLFFLDGVVINPAAFTKTGYSILDALTATGIPFVEVHLSNINARESWHAETIFSSKAAGHINGFQSYSYILGLYGLNHIISKEDSMDESDGR